MVVVAKPGARLRSVTCSTEVVVVRGDGQGADLRCGGQPMVDVADTDAATAEVAAPFDGGSLMGKRYVNEDETLEVLCTKAGAGSLSVGEDALAVKGAKPLPASD
jgi:hypothetical protein